MSVQDFTTTSQSRVAVVLALVSMALLGMACDSRPRNATVTSGDPGAVVHIPPPEEAARAGNHIRLRRVGQLGAGSDSDPLFYRPTRSAFDAAGNRYVLDPGAHQVHVFSADGTYVRSSGRHGQGPGELDRERDIAVNDRFYSVLVGPRRIVNWALSGSLASDRLVEDTVYPFVRADEHGDRQPVDVYSPEGERLFTGTIDMPWWSTARGDHVYTREVDEQTSEYVLVTWKLDEPF